MEELLWTTKEKNQARKIVCRKRNKPFKKVLLLPSSTALDFKEMLKNGAIKSGYTTVVAIERDRVKAAELTKVLVDAKLPYSVIVKELVNVDLAEVVGTGLRFDFVYLDTCSILNHKMLQWLVKVKRNYFKIFNENAILITSFCDYMRQGTNFMKAFHNFVIGKGDAYEGFRVSEKAVRTKTLDIGDLKDSEFAIKSFKTIRNLLRAMFGGGEHIRYKSGGNKFTMTVSEFQIDHNMRHTAFLEEFLSTYTDRTIPPKKDKVVPVLKAAKPLSKHYTQVLAGWKAHSTRVKLDPKTSQINIIEKTILFATGQSPEDIKTISTLLAKELGVPTSTAKKISLVKGIKPILRLRKLGKTYTQISAELQEPISRVIKVCDKLDTKLATNKYKDAPP